MGVIDGRVADEPDLLREHEHVLVFEAHIQVDGFAVDHHGLRLVVHLVDDGVPRRHGVLLETVAPFTKTRPSSMARAAAEREA